jgi:hypothetical protein
MWLPLCWPQPTPLPWRFHLQGACREVRLTKGQTVIGIEAEDLPNRAESFRYSHALDQARRFTYAGTAGNHNQHMMTGRIV